MGGTLGSSTYTLVVVEDFVSAIPGLKVPTRPNNVILAKEIHGSMEPTGVWGGGLEPKPCSACRAGDERGNRRESRPAEGAAGVLWK